MPLNTGDIAFVQYNADGTDNFAFVALANIPAGEVIKFTDNGRRSTNVFRIGEGEITWTVPAGGVAAGTVVTISGFTGTTTSSSIGSASKTGSINFAADGDQILAYQGSIASPSFIAALNNEGSAIFQTDATNARTSALPTGLTTGTNAIALNEIDNARYNGSILSGTREQLLAAINNRSNWTGSDTANQTFSGTFTVLRLVNLSVNSTAGTEAGTTVITVTATASSAVSGNQTVSLGVSGTGITAGDYSLSNTTLTIPSGSTTGSVTFTVADDVLVEGTETATLTISNPSAGITLGSTTAQNILIADNDFPIISLAAGTNPAEGSTQGTYTLTLNTPAPTGGLTINYTLIGSIATTPADYTLEAGTNITGVTGSSFTIAAGQTSATLLVNAINDGIADPNETVKLNLAAGSGYITGHNSTTPFAAATAVEIGTQPYSVAIGDFNGDGKADFATANLNASTVSIRLGDGLGGFMSTTNVPVGAGPLSVAIADFNGDGKADVATANSDNTVSIRLGNGSGGFTGTTTVPVGLNLNTRSVAIGDFNGDGKADFATANFNASTVSIRLGDGSGGFTGTLDVPVGSNPYSVAIGDFNGDGKADFAAANYFSNNVSIRLGNGLGGFTGTTNVAVGPRPYSVAIGDFNGDGKADFAATSINSSTVSIRLGDGLGNFTGTPDVAVGSNPQSVAIGDFNGDGKADFATANTNSNSVSIRLGNGLGGFTGTTDVAVGSGPWSVAISDFNGDGKADIAAGSANSGNVSVLLNNAPTATLTIADAPTVNLSVSSTAGTEAGTIITVTATASSAVSGNQTLNLGVSGTNITAGDYSLSNSTITILNGQTIGTVTFTVVDDAIVEALETAILTLSNPSAGIVLGTTTTQSINITDNDTAGVTITQSGGTTAITEGGATDTYTVVLTSQPTADVTLSIGNGSETSTNTNTLTFTATNWNTAQTVTVTAVDDLIAEGNDSGTITHTAISTDANYNGLAIGSVTASITDNDNPPTDLILSATTLNENVAPNTLIGNFTTLDPDGGSFTYSLIPGTGSINNSAFTIVGDQLWLNASPDFETQPSYSIQVRTTDFSGLSYDKQISITVNDLNDAPILTDTVVALTRVRSNAPAPLGAVGTSITQLANLTGGSGQNNVIDPDTGALTGIAITNVDSLNGSWFYSTNNGINWTAIGGVSNANALLLADDANTRLYFRPNTGYTGTLANAITYRAWDQTSGTNGATADTTTNGNPTAFSVQFDTASLQVNRTATTDLTQDGKADILWRNRLNGQNVVWEMDGTTYQKSTFLIPVDPKSGWEIVGMGDFTQDDKTDILWRNRLSGQNVVWEMDGTTYKKSTFLIPVDPKSGWEIVGTGDFTQDGKTDILWRNSLDGQNVVWEMDGTTYQKTTLLPSVSASSGWKITGVSDFTKDGNPDILWHNIWDGSVAVWGMNGTAYSSFFNVGTVSTSSGWNIV